MRTNYYQHKEHGYLVTYDEMIDIMRTDYDLDDTNMLGWAEYFTETNMRVNEVDDQLFDLEEWLQAEIEAAVVEYVELEMGLASCEGDC